MGEYISDVNLLKARRYLHSGITDCDVTDDIPALEWAPHWLQRIDLKLNVLCGRLSQFRAVAFRTHHIYADWNQSERKNKHGNDDASTDGISPET